MRHKLITSTSRQHRLLVLFLPLVIHAQQITDSHSTLWNMGMIPGEPDIAHYHCSYSVWAHWEVTGHFINEGGYPKTLALGFMWGNGGEDEGCRDSRASLSDIFSQWGQISVPWPSSQAEINHRTPELEDLGGSAEGENETQQEDRTCPRSYRERVSETQVYKKNEGPLCSLQTRPGFKEEQIFEDVNFFFF